MDKDRYEKEKYFIKKAEESFWIDYRIATKNEIINEVVFCLMTPQSSAESAHRALSSVDFRPEKLTPEILSSSGVRFHNNKHNRIKDFLTYGTKYVFDLIQLSENNRAIRNTLRSHIKGFGLKEASHFMRNIGRGDTLAILDRHIIKCMQERNLIESEITLNDKNYRLIEKVFCDYADDIEVPHAHLDMLWWGSKSGKYFK